MKISVIYAVAQMSMGTVMKATNAVYNRDWVKFFTEALTQFVLIYVLFGLMDLFIIIKWLTDWSNLPKGKTEPGVINLMIVMFINGGTTPKEDKSVEIMNNQKAVMNICTILALISIPPMLLGVPCLGRKSHKTADEDYESEKILRIREVQELAKHNLSIKDDHDSFQAVFIH